MKYSEGTVGRVFVIRLEDGDPMPKTLEAFCEKQGVLRGLCFLIGGVGADGKLVVGPENPKASPIVPMTFTLDGVHEIAGVGSVFPDESGKPKLHMHAAVGRGEHAHVGCIRLGVTTWKVGEVILLEISGNAAERRMDKDAGFHMLHP